jgi:hypothetical protein
MESNTLNDPTSKLNEYVTESLKGFFRYHVSRMKDVLNIYIVLLSKFELMCTKGFFYRLLIRTSSNFAKITIFEK